MHGSPPLVVFAIFIVIKFSVLKVISKHVHVLAKYKMVLCILLHLILNPGDSTAMTAQMVLPKMVIGHL